MRTCSGSVSPIWMKGCALPPPCVATNSPGRMLTARISPRTGARTTERPISVCEREAAACAVRTCASACPRRDCACASWLSATRRLSLAERALPSACISSDWLIAAGSSILRNSASCWLAVCSAARASLMAALAAAIAASASRTEACASFTRACVSSSCARMERVSIENSGWPFSTRSPGFTLRSVTRPDRAEPTSISSLDGSTTPDPATRAASANSPEARGGCSSGSMVERSGRSIQIHAAATTNPIMAKSGSTCREKLMRERGFAIAAASPSDLAASQCRHALRGHLPARGCGRPCRKYGCRG